MSLTADQQEKRTRLQALLDAGEGHKLVEAVLERDAEIATLRRLLDRALKPFAQKSERLGLEQLLLGLEGLSAEARKLIAEDEAAAREELERRKSSNPPRRRAPIRRPLPEHLPRVTNVIEPEPQDRRCGDCGRDKAAVGVEKTEYLERIPASLQVRVVERHTYACSHCKDGIVTPPAPPRPVQGGLAGSSVLADVVTRKFALHQPLYRIRQAYALEGVDLAESTLGDWTAAVADELAPLVAHWEARVLNAWCIRTDDTGVRVLDRESEHGVKKGHLWPYLSDDECIFKYTPSKKAAGARSFLANARCTHLQSDAAPAYDAIHKRGVIEVGCWMHTRRYFYAAHESGDGRAMLPLFIIAQMYEVEDQGRRLSPPERAKLRSEKTRPLLEKLDLWRDSVAPDAPPKTPLGQALTYLRNQRAALAAFIDDGRLPMDNGEVERALRRVAVGRKNWLFFGSDTGAERGAILYSVIVTCLMHGANPLAYIADVLQRIAEGWPHRRLDDLHPKVWLETHPACRLVVQDLPETQASPNPAQE